jgi:hypothetical protein
MLIFNHILSCILCFTCSHEGRKVDYLWGYVIVFLLLFFYLVCEAIGTAAAPDLLWQPRVIVKMIVEKQMEYRLAGEPKLSEKTCPSTTFVHHKIPHDETRVWTRAAAVESRRLTAWAMAQPRSLGLSIDLILAATVGPWVRHSL